MRSSKPMTRRRAAIGAILVVIGGLRGDDHGHYAITSLLPVACDQASDPK